MTSDERVALVRAASAAYLGARATLDAATVAVSRTETTLRKADALLTDADRAKLKDPE